MSAVVKLGMVCAILFPFVVNAEEMKVYDFTADFVSCVKQYDAESDEYVRPGVSESSLMNGRSQLNAGSFDANYWAYMSCLTKNRGGTRSGALQKAQVCPERYVTTSRGQVYIPSGVSGKRVGVLGSFWVCNGSNWVTDSGAITLPGGGGKSAPTVPSTGCAAKSLSSGNCRFDFPAMSHGSALLDRFGPTFGNSGSYEGEMTALCNNGVISPVSATCVASTCSSGATVSWSGATTSGQSALCSGVVSYDGSASQGASAKQYFSSMELALLGTKIVTGSAYFGCESGRWVNLGAANSICQLKSPAELRCYSETISGVKRFYCE